MTQAKRSATLVERWLVLCVCVEREESRILPHDAVESCNAEKIPLGGNPTPELV